MSDWFEQMLEDLERIESQPRAQVSPGVIYERREDMSPDGRLRILIQEDGDIIVAIVPPSESGQRMVSVEFCAVGSGGGHSPRTLKVLRWLADAIRRDNEEWPT